MTANQSKPTFPVSSFENQHHPYSPLGSDHRVLPETYTPVTSTSQLAQQFDDTERHIQQQMPMHKPEWYSGNNDNMVNKGLFERRFFAGGPAPTNNPVPVRFTSSSISASAPSSGPIFSRTFDLTMQPMPDVTFERQSRNTRYG